ncbi:hypothetical protein ACLOJK_023889 [Asimina triloba]
MSTGDIQTIVEVNLKRTAAAVLDQARDLCDKKSITDYELLVTEGDARHVLCEAVDKFHADMLVLGSHGAGSLRRAILGSVSDYCAHHAHCSLLIIKKPKSKSGKDHNHHLHWKEMLGDDIWLMSLHFFFFVLLVLLILLLIIIIIRGFINCHLDRARVYSLPLPLSFYPPQPSALRPFSRAAAAAMEEGRQSVVDISKSLSPPSNPIAQLQVRFKELETGFRCWLAKQPLAVEAAIVTATNAAQGAAIGAFMGTLTGDISSSFPTPPPQTGLNPQAMASLKQAQALSGGPLVQARNFAVMTGVNAGISCVMKRIRGVEDVQSSMVAAFGSGAMFSLVSGVGGPNVAANAVTSGLFFALVQGGLFKLGQQFSQPPVEDVFYVKTRYMLANLGLQNYEKNFKKGLLTDSTLPLLTDSALKDAKIPPGPRLLILDHVQSEQSLDVYCPIDSPGTLRLQNRGGDKLQISVPRPAQMVLSKLS